MIQKQRTPGGRGKDSGAPGSKRAEGDGRGDLTIGVGVYFAGDIVRCHHINVAGEVEATVPAASLEVQPGGRFKGVAEVENATVAGDFDGTLTVFGLLTIAATGRVNGTIRYSELAIDTGGQISGDVQVRGREASVPLRTGDPAFQTESALQSESARQSESAAQSETPPQSAVEREPDFAVTVPEISPEAPGAAEGTAPPSDEAVPESPTPAEEAVPGNGRKALNRLARQLADSPYA